jgi:hypothetical protein
MRTIWKRDLPARSAIEQLNTKAGNVIYSLRRRACKNLICSRRVVLFIFGRIIGFCFLINWSGHNFCHPRQNTAPFYRVHTACFICFTLITFIAGGSSGVAAAEAECAMFDTKFAAA